MEEWGGINSVNTQLIPELYTLAKKRGSSNRKRPYNECYTISCIEIWGVYTMCSFQWIEEQIWGTEFQWKGLIQYFNQYVW